jgi:hypothetical protein
MLTVAPALSDSQIVRLPISLSAQFMLTVASALSASLGSVSSHILKCSIHADLCFSTFCFSVCVSSHTLKYPIHADRRFGTF